MRPGNIGAGEARATDLGGTAGGGGNHVVYVAGNPDHRVERRASETEAAGQSPVPFAAKG